jgi:hypothetical protein
MVKASLRNAKAGSATKSPAATQPVVDVPATVVTSAPAAAHTVQEATVDGVLADIAEAQQLEAGEQIPETAPAAQTSTAVATRPTNTAVARPVQHEEGFEGDWGKEDLKFPQLKLVQGSGPLSQRFNNGTIIFDEEKLLPAPNVEEGADNPLITFVPLVITKQYREKLSQDDIDDGALPRIANSLAEVEDLGGTTRYVNNERPDNYWEPSSRCIFLVERPVHDAAADHQGFNEVFDGREFAVAVYYAAGAAFTACPKVIYNTYRKSLFMPILGADRQPLVIDGRIQKRPCIYKNYWSLGFAKVKAGKFNPWRPYVRLQKVETGPEVREYCAQLLQAAPQAPHDDDAV